MTTLPKELSPERCHELREGGFLRLLVNLLHEHTFQLQDKPEAEFSIELFFMDFNRKAELRARLSNQIRTIVKHTAKNWNELIILGSLEALQRYIGRLYNFIVGWKAMTENSSKLSECIDQLTELAGQVKGVIKQLGTLTTDDEIRSIFEQFGGVFVIVDYLRAQTRFNAKCHQFESNLIDTSQLLCVAEDSKLLLGDAVIILNNFLLKIDLNDVDIRIFLGNSRSLHEIMVGIAENAYDDGDLRLVRLYCGLLYSLYYIDDPIVPTGVRFSPSLLKDCGAIKCLAKFGMEIKDPETLYYVILALEGPLALDRQNVLEFLSIDGAVDILIDVLVPSKEKDEDVENAKWYKKQRQFSLSVLDYINDHLSPQDRLGGRLLAIYESRDFAAILLHHLELITSINEDSPTTGSILALLSDILVSSEDQRQKFTEIVNSKEVVKRFESADDEDCAQFSKEIGEMFE